MDDFFFPEKKTIETPWFRKLLTNGALYCACIWTFCEGKGLDDLANSVLALAKKFGSSKLSCGREKKNIYI